MEEVNNQSSSNVWNFSDSFVKSKILLHLIEFDSLMKTALYGAEHLNDSFIMPQSIRDTSRVEALRRLIDILKIIKSNSLFVIKNRKPKDVPIMEKLIEKVEEVEEYVDGAYEIIEDTQRGIKFIQIDENNEIHFRACLNALRKIQEKMLTPLNNSELIFSSSDEVDIDTIKQQLIEGG